LHRGRDRIGGGVAVSARDVQYVIAVVVLMLVATTFLVFMSHFLMEIFR